VSPLNVPAIPAQRFYIFAMNLKAIIKTIVAWFKAEATTIQSRMILNWRLSAEYSILAPTIEAQATAFRLRSSRRCGSSKTRLPRCKSRRSPSRYVCAVRPDTRGCEKQWV
jgi:hypothetical protein